jgi:hypothetical protein
MLPPDNVTNIRAVLDADQHALPVWAVRALRLLLDEREHLIAGLMGETASEEMAKIRRRIGIAHQLLAAWTVALDQPPPQGDPGDEPDECEKSYLRGYARAMRSCIYDLRAVLTQDFSSPHG